MNGNVRIVSDGTTYGTKVLVDGIQVKYVGAVHILPMSANNSGAVRAVIEVIGPELDIVANLAHEEVITLKVDAEEIQATMYDELLTIAGLIEEKNPEAASALRKVSIQGIKRIDRSVT